MLLDANESIHAMGEAESVLAGPITIIDHEVSEWARP